MEDFFAQFVREWKYLQNVSPFTIAAHRWAWDAFAPVVSGRNEIVRADVLQRISELREGGLTALTVNTYVRSINAFLHWLHAEGRTPQALVIPRLKEDQKVLPIFTVAHIVRLMAFKPTLMRERRFPGHRLGDP